MERCDYKKLGGLLDHILAPEPFYRLTARVLSLQEATEIMTASPARETACFVVPGNFYIIADLNGRAWLTSFIHRRRAAGLMSYRPVRLGMDEVAASLRKADERDYMHALLFDSPRLRILVDRVPDEPPIIELERGRCVAVVDRRLCHGCGICSLRCRTRALSYRITSQDYNVSINPVQCYGGGLCATACPRHAIRLVPREALHDAGLCQGPGKQEQPAAAAGSAPAAG